MKTIGVALIVLIVVAGMLVSLGAMSGYLDLNIEFGLKDDIAAIQTSNSPDIVIIADNDDEPDVETQVQVPPPKSIFWYQTPFKTIFWKPEFAEMPPMETAEVDWDDLIKKSDPPEVYIPDPPETIENSDIIGVIENPNIPGIVDPNIRYGTGKIWYMDVEGGFYGIVSDDGEHYDPINLASEFQVDSLQVSFTVKILDMVSIHMWGTAVEILEIEMLD